MSRDIDGQKLGQQKKKLKSKHKFFFSSFFSRAELRKIATHYGQIFLKRSRKKGFF